MFCKKCGNKLSDDAKFCGKCGEKTEVKVGSDPISNPIEAKPQSSNFQVASSGKRLVDLILDYIGAIVWAFVIAYLLGVTGLYSGLGIAQVNSTVLGIIFYLSYYLFFESIWQKTPAKFLTGTKVVMKDGTKPGFWNILGRTLCRIIPFEAFTFLRSNPIGLHDSLSGTLVVPNNYAAEDVKKINTNEKTKRSGLMIVIVILIVIAVIAVLSAIVLVNVTSYINKGKDAAIKGNLSTIMTNGAVFYDANKNYSGFCNDSTVTTPQAAITSAGGTSTCTTDYNNDAFCACSTLKSDSASVYCVDSAGASKEVPSTDCNTECPAAGTCL